MRHRSCTRNEILVASIPRSGCADLGGLHLQEANRKGENETNFPPVRQLQPKQTRNGQRQDHDISEKIEDAVNAKDGLLAAAVTPRGIQVPVGLDGLADQQRAHDTRDCQEGDADAGGL